MRPTRRSSGPHRGERVNATGGAPAVKALLRRSVAGALLGLGLLGAPGSASAQLESATEEVLKAAFIYNLAKFVDWPSESFAEAEDPLVVCLGEGPFADLFEERTRGKTVHSRALQVRRWAQDDPVGHCNLLFLTDLTREQRSRIIQAAEGQSVLTIGDMDHFAEEGGVLNLVKVRDKLRFEINPVAADRANLRISSKLMRLAQVVPDRSRERLE